MNAEHLQLAASIVAGFIGLALIAYLIMAAAKFVDRCIEKKREQQNQPLESILEKDTEDEYAGGRDNESDNDD